MLESEEEIPKRKYFTRGQEQAIQLLGAGSSNVETAKACGVSEGTVRKWLKDEDFQEAVLEAKENLPQLQHEELFKELPKMEKRAVEVLGELMEQEKNPMARLKAAMMVLTLRNTLNGGDKALSITFSGMPEPGIPKGVISHASDSD